MRELIKTLIDNKKVLILGYGREGRSTMKVLRECGGYAELAVADMKDVSNDLPEGVTAIVGEGYLDSPEAYDVVFKSPGVVLKKPVSEYPGLITSQTEVFMQKHRNDIIGVTGTKGKSTTSSLLYHTLKTAGKEALLAGNIGIPVFDIEDEIKPDTVIVTELSCHQLEYLKTSPGRAILLNIYEDHLDHYGTREKYAAAKKNIYLNQKPSDLLFTTEETVLNEHIDADCPSKLVKVTAKDLPFKNFDELQGVKLMGEHNLLNCAFVWAACEGLGVSKEAFKKAVESFEPLPHRLERFLSINGMDFYDDSISTTVKSAISAVETVKNASILLLGGMERNLEYGELVEFLHTSKLDYVVCMYESGARIFELFKKKPGGPEVVCVKDLEEAVSFSVSKMKPGNACILSPAAASYGYFKNFEERGDAFKDLVLKLTKK